MDISEYISDALEKLPRQNAVDSRIVLQDIYETKTGIYNHFASKDRPLASVAMFPCEDTAGNSPLYDNLEEFAEKGYYELWGLNLKEFLSLPQYQVKILREITTRIYNEKKAVAANLNLDLPGLSGKKR